MIARSPIARDRRLLLAVLGMVLVGINTAATAELYRCVRADGRTVFTDSKATCPGAQEHRPAGEIQSYRAAASARQPASSGRRRAAQIRSSDTATAEASWRKKMHDVNEELQTVTNRIGNLHPLVKNCNRGGTVFRTQENGLRAGVPCDSLRADVSRLEQRRAELQRYLDHGLQEDCRKSGCLPGWLR